MHHFLSTAQCFRQHDMLKNHTNKVFYNTFSEYGVPGSVLMISSNIVKPRSFYFASNGVSHLVLDFAFSSAVSEHHSSLAGTKDFSFWINLVLHGCSFDKATQLYFLTAPCSVVSRDNLGKRVQESTRQTLCSTPECWHLRWGTWHHQDLILNIANFLRGSWYLWYLAKWTSN